MLYARVYHITADVQNVPVGMLKYNRGGNINNKILIIKLIIK